MEISNKAARLIIPTEKPIKPGGISIGPPVSCDMGSYAGWPGFFQSLPARTTIEFARCGRYDQVIEMPRHLLLPAILLFLPCCGRPVGSTTTETQATAVEVQNKPAPHDGKELSPTTPGVIAPASINASSLIAPLIDPAKLATLGNRGANARIQKITTILWQAKQDGQNPSDVAAKAVERIGWGNTAKGRLTADAMVRNVTILERLGSTTPGDLDDMRHGKTATVRTGPYAGEVLSVDHIIPRAIVPELDNVIANLELMPLSVNQSKNDKIGERQISMAKAFHDAGLLSDSGFQRVMAAKQ